MREGSRSPVKRKLTVLEDGQVERGHGGVESGGGALRIWMRIWEMSLRRSSRMEGR